jgi:predicted nucleic acid-binding protein
MGSPVIVADTNLIVCTLLDGPHRAAAEAVVVRDSAWAAPRLWRSEFRNVLVQYCWEGSLSLSACLGLVARAEQLLGDRQYNVPTFDVISLAAGSRRSAYDCELVALARVLSVPLVTCDRRLAAAFPGTAMTLEEFVGGA